MVNYILKHSLKTKAMIGSDTELHVA